MLRQNLGKTNLEYWQWLWKEYQHQHPGSFLQEDLVDWALKNRLVDLPRIDPKKLLLKKAKDAARASRIHDKQGRLVREMLPAKVPMQVDKNGNMLMFEVRYDHIHTMSVDHALLAFDQRDENIKKQKRSASRDRDSFVENNPNAVGHENLFLFDFDQEATVEQMVQKIEESPTLPPKG